MVLNIISKVLPCPIIRSLCMLTYIYKYMGVFTHTHTYVHIHANTHACITELSLI